MTIPENSGLDLTFNTSALADGNYIDTEINIDITSGSLPANTVVRISRSGNTYITSIYEANGMAIYESYAETEIIPLSIRIFVHGMFLSIYFNENWIHTFYFPNIQYTEYSDQLVYLSSGSPISLSNVVLYDLFDWREAIFVDFDQVAANAVASIIQQRPVEINSVYSGDVKFEYPSDTERDILSINQKLITKVTKDEVPQGIMSDAIVYGSEVQVVVDNDTAKQHGFITKIIRVPELDNGARRASKEYIKQALQKSTMYTITMRADLRIEIGDVIQCSYTLSGTGKVIPINCIVETVSFVIKNAQFSMTITGREYA